MPAAAALPPLVNLRDVGGHPARGGGLVRTGLLYRSTELSGLDDSALDALARMGIRTVYDLRTRGERELHADRLPAGTRAVALDVLADAPEEASPRHVMSLMDDLAKINAFLADGGGVRYFKARYRELVELDSARHAYGLLFLDLARDGSCPGIVHCTTGKDRTGWAVAALLLLLGVPEEHVMHEYLRSNAVLEAAFAPALEAFRARGGDPELLRPMVGVRASYLETSLDVMRQRFGTVEAYFAAGLGVDEAVQDRLREAFVGPAPRPPRARA